jgi:hypothetical protein
MCASGGSVCAFRPFDDKVGVEVDQSLARDVATLLQFGLANFRTQSRAAHPIDERALLVFLTRSTVYIYYACVNAVELFTRIT